MFYSQNNCQKALQEHTGNIYLIGKDTALINSLIHFTQKYGAQKTQTLFEAEAANVVEINSKSKAADFSSANKYLAYSQTKHPKFQDFLGKEVVLINITTHNPSAFYQAWTQTYSSVLKKQITIPQTAEKHIYNLFILEHIITLQHMELPENQILEILYSSYSPTHKQQYHQYLQEKVFLLANERLKHSSK